MTGKMCWVFLITGMLLAGSVSAEENSNQALANRKTEQVGIGSEITVKSHVALKKEANPAVSGKGSAVMEEADQKSGSASGADVSSNSKDSDNDYETGDAVEEATIADPIEPFNRAMFQFNDKLYFWALKPVAQGYSKIVPEPARVSVRNLFRNVKMPVRFVNSLLQGKFLGAGTELARFGINTTIGVAGFFDVAKDKFDLDPSDEDFGQTLGFYGMGGLMYIVWPILGPSTVRDTVGLAGDTFLNPVSYIDPLVASIGVKVYEQINKTSLEIGVYEDLVASSLEPYIGVRDAFVQYRKKQINK